MKNIFKKNQIIITALAIMIVIAGYLTFSGKDNKAQNDDANTASNIDLENYDLAATLENETIIVEDGIQEGEDLEDDEILDISQEDIENNELAAVDVTDTGELVVETVTEAENPGEAVLASNLISAGFFSTEKLKREQTRAKNKETINEIINNKELADNLKQDAINRLIEITNTAEIENATELMLAARGFDDAVVSIIDGKVDVVVNAATLTDQQVAQIEDVVTKKTGISLLNVYIYPVVTEE